ncbi:hypothetical protein TD95_005319 [Thielaviopsis punctulata]|uniref:DEK C-terminal domain-containing protein n=1 Tax=Thielaviopsis punctulata TaxID=72032 RepID=A0A0F4ZEQ7_9PEZI|nr:hypothetical protein TD95_005319 [Thielaviopsis punctulata]
MPSSSELKEALRIAVKQLWDNGEGDQITVNRVRKSVESKLSLEAGFFTKDEWNRQSRDIIKNAVEEMEDAESEAEEEIKTPEKPTAGNKRKASTSVARDSKRSKKAGSDNESQPEDDTKDANDSDSDMSSVIDEPPSRRRGSKASSAKAAGPPKAKAKAKASSASGSADQQEVKKLQQQLAKCGVRKVWGVELKAFGDDDRAKIRHLKGMLRDVGMTGRFSDARAKEIKEQRELMADLQEVQAMDRTWGASEDGARSSRSSRRAAPKSLKIEKQVIEGLSDSEGDDDDDDNDDDESDEDDKPKKKRKQTVGSDDDDDDDDDDDASVSEGVSEDESSEAEMTEESEEESYGRKKKKGGARQRKRVVDDDDSDEDSD